MKPANLTPEEHARIAAAIATAEARTSGEIYCVVARSSGGYFFPSGFYLTASILVASLIAAIVADRQWTPVPLPHFVAAQLLAVALAIILLRVVPVLRLAFVPPRHLYAAAHDNALKQFLARNVHRTAARTGVLIFVSLAERHAVVLADSGINAKVPPQHWDAIVAGLVARAGQHQLAEGFVEAIATVGQTLAEHFPPDAGDRNELDDHLAEI